MARKKPHNQLSTKQIWVKKLDLHCNMVCTSLQDIEEIRINKKNVVDELGELDHSGDVIYDVPEEVSEDVIRSG